MIDEGTYGGRRTGAYLAWFDDEDGEEGAAIGQDGGFSLEVLEKKREDSTEKEYWTVEIAAKKFAEENGMELDSICGWVTESKATFKHYKAAMLAALDTCGRDMPPWVELALAAGWKMPKGWKP